MKLLNMNVYLIVGGVDFSVQVSWGENGIQ